MSTAPEASNAPGTEPTPLVNLSATTPTWLPTKPIMGGIHQVSKDEHTPWTGGLPKSDWTGLSETAGRTPVSPNQYRSMVISTAQKGHIHRQTGLAVKFTRAGDLSTFEHLVWTHMVDTGMDTIAYVPDPVDKTTMLNCVKFHGRFSVESIRTMVATQVLSYDDFDKANNREAQQFLLASLDPELARELRDVMDESEPFPVTLLRLIHMIRSASIDRFENLKVRIKSRKPAKYPGQDLSKMAVELRADALELDIAGQYDHNLTLHMLDAFLEAGGANNEDFRYPLRATKTKLSAALLEIGYMPRDVAKKHMGDLGLTYRDICTEAVKTYRSQFDNGKWPPARGISDNRAPPATFGNLAVLDHAHAYALLQQGTGTSSPGTGNCLNCGNPGHWARDCPTRRPQRGGRGGRGGPGRGRSGPSRACSRPSGGGATPHPMPGPRPPLSTTPLGWKKTAPRPGEPLSKSVEGRAWRWCSKCGRWSTTHGTDQHSGPTRQPGSQPQANNLVAFPGAWAVPFPPAPTNLDTFFALLSLLPGSTFPLFFAAGLGYSIALLFAPLWPLLVANWTLLFPVLFWLLCLALSLTAPHLPPPRLHHFRHPSTIHFGRPRREGDCWRPRNKRGWSPARPKARHRPTHPPKQATAFLTATEALRAALTTPHETKHHLSKEHCFPVIWDSGASISISSFRSDFVGPIEKPPFNIRLQGIAKGLTIGGVGHVAWSFVDTRGMLRTLKLPAYLVPGATARLLSTTSLLQQYPTESITQESGRMSLSGSLSENTTAVEVLTDPYSNLHVASAWDPSMSDTVHSALTAAISTTSARNVNLTPAERELLRWHHRLGHLSFKKVQFLLQSGALAFSEPLRRLQTSAARLTSYPMCASCQYGKQRRTTAPGRTVHTVREREGALKTGDLFPGQKLSVDHFLSSTRGRLKHTYGKEDAKSQYAGGAIFVDHASGYIFINHQVHLTTHETIESKEAFEAHCRDAGVVIGEYLSDNGSAFTSTDYRAHLQTFSQISKFAGVGAHHHNGVAERSIQTVMSIARTMLLHSAIHWPDVADAALWPLAVDHAVRLHNFMPNPATGISPHDLFTKTRWSLTNFQNFHVFGCPVYVLDKTIQDGRKLPRWKPRSSRQVYVGLSNKHASTVPLCLSLDSGAITPQFHVVFDEDFTTVSSDPNTLPDFASPQWHEMLVIATTSTLWTQMTRLPKTPLT